MRNINDNIQSIFTKILKEEIEKKSKSMSGKFGEWVEIDLDEKLHGNQKKLDVAKPKGKLTKADFEALRMKAKNKKDVDESKTLSLSENELVDLIEEIVKKQIIEKTEVGKLKKPEGLRKTMNILDKNKKENDDYSKEVVKKMKDYLKGTNSDYDENPNHFPKGNGELGDVDKKAYKASDEVEEYIEAFAYPGLENTLEDEIKSDKNWVNDNIKGSSKTGNNPKWGNAVETDLGERIIKKREKNLYQKEKGRSYKRVPQPVENVTQKNESSDERRHKLVTEELKKITDLYTYNRKTQ